MDEMMAVVLAIILGTLSAIVISLKYILIIERRMARMELHLEKLVMKISKEEDLILAEELKIEKKLKPRGKNTRRRT